MQRVDGSGDHDARRAQKQRIALDRLNERAAHAALLLLRQHKDGIEAALSRVFVVRAEGGAADLLLCIRSTPEPLLSSVLLRYPPFLS